MALEVSKNVTVKSLTDRIKKTTNKFYLLLMDNNAVCCVSILIFY